MTTYHHANVRGRKLFYREAGSKDSPTIVLLHGFPSSSHMFRDLIPRLADKLHVIAPDYVGFGYSDAPSAKEFEYTFDNLAAHVEELLFKNLGLKQFSVYVQDYGAPVGYRIASKHPDAIREHRRAERQCIRGRYRRCIRPDEAVLGESQRRNREAGARATEERNNHLPVHARRADTERISPDSYTLDQFFLDRPGNDAIQLDLLYNYQSNVALYDRWHEYFRKQPAENADSSGERTTHSSPSREPKPTSEISPRRSCT